MKQRPLHLIAALMVVLWCALAAGTAVAVPYEGRMAVVLVIDASGSMAHNDPERVRVEAAQKMVEILKDEDYLAAIEFATGVRPLVPMRQVGGEAARQEIAALISGAGQRGDTNILGALRAAFHQLETVPAGARPFVILLSDGESDVPGVTTTPAGRKQYFADTEALLARYREEGRPVHCIAFHEAEAGAELQNIAAKTGGEYQFVTQAGDLKNIFAGILLAAKYPPGEQPVFHAALQEQEEYLIGDRLAAEAYITIGEDLVLPGPYLELTGMHLVLAAGGADPLLIPFVQTGDGLFQAEYVPQAPGAYEALAAVTGRYRGQEISASVDLGPFTAVAKPGASLGPVDAQQVQSVAGLLLLGIGFILLSAVTFLVWRARLRERVGGELRVCGTRSGDVRYTKHQLRLGRARRSEVRVATCEGRDVHFVLEPVEREFAFMIRTVRDPVQDPQLSRFRRLLKGPVMLYEVVCSPGTAMQMGNRLRTRSDLYHEDVFEVGGYAFEFCLPRLGTRPGGADVLDSYSPLLRDEPEPKGGKIITLRLGRDE